MSNLERMLELVETAFYDRDGADGQITVDEHEREKLQAISQLCLTEYNDGNGPAIWLLMVPTTQELMRRFVAGTIDEVTLLNQTPVGITYDALYLCSAITLPEYRNRGLTLDLAAKTIKRIRNQHPVQTLFYWPFSEAGEKLARSLSVGQKIRSASKIWRHFW